MRTTRRSATCPPLVPQRVRCIGKEGFAFIPNRFLHGGFCAALRPDELLLYFLLVIASDRNGLSFYHYDSLCSLLQMPIERYLLARNNLIDKDLIAFDGTRFQVLELPAQMPTTPGPLQTTTELELDDPATVRAMIEQSLRQTDGAQERGVAPRAAAADRNEEER